MCRTNPKSNLKQSEPGLGDRLVAPDSANPSFPDGFAIDTLKFLDVGDAIPTTQGPLDIVDLGMGHNPPLQQA